jgi:hypothetical protein
MSRAEYDLAVAETLSETAWQAQIVRLAQTLGMMCYHTLDSRGSERGFPDLTILGNGRLILMELKRQALSAVLTTNQVAWLDGLARLRDSGGSRVEVYMARPLDRDALVNTLYGSLTVAQGSFLHGWCLDPGCERCTDERRRAKPSVRQRRGRRNRRKEVGG